MKSFSKYTTIKYGIVLYMKMYIVLWVSVIFISCGTASNEMQTEGPDSVYLSTRGPNGEIPVKSNLLNINQNLEQKIRTQVLRAALVMHEDESLFSKTVITGVEETLKRYGVQLIYSEASGFDASLQAEQLKNALALKPDFLISLIIDPESTAEVLKANNSANVKFVFLSNIPSGFEFPGEYAGIVTDDLFQAGREAADLIKQALASYVHNSQDSIAVMYHDADYYVTNQRDQALKSVLQLSYPEIKIAAEIPVKNIKDTEKLTRQLLKSHPDIKVIYAPWATIAIDVLKVLKAAGREDIKLITIDLEAELVHNMLNDGAVYGIVTDRPYDIGRNLVINGIFASLEIPVPAMTVVPVHAVTKADVIENWYDVFKIAFDSKETP